MASFYRITDEEAERRSKQAKEMNAIVVIDEETGLERRKFGGPQPRSGRPRKIRMSEKVAEKVASEADAYFDRLDGIVKNGTDGNAIAAFRTLREVEEAERKLSQEEEERLDKLQRDELLALVVGKLMSLEDSGGLKQIQESEVIRELE